MFEDNGTIPTYVKDKDFSEEVKQAIDDAQNTLDPLNVTLSIFTLSAHHDIVNIPPTIPANNDHK